MIKIPDNIRYIFLKETINLELSAIKINLFFLRNNEVKTFFNQNTRY